MRHGTLTLNRAKAPGLTVFVPPLSLTFLPLTLAVPRTVTDASLLVATTTVIDFPDGAANESSTITGQAVWNAALCGHRSWVVSP